MTGVQTCALPILRNMIAREEKKIIKSLGTTGAVTTILALFGITNF